MTSAQNCYLQLKVFAKSPALRQKARCGAALATLSAGASGDQGGSLDLEDLTKHLTDSTLLGLCRQLSTPSSVPQWEQ